MRAAELSESPVGDIVKSAREAWVVSPLHATSKQSNHRKKRLAQRNATKHYCLGVDMHSRNLLVITWASRGMVEGFGIEPWCYEMNKNVNPGAGSFRKSPITISSLQSNTQKWYSLSLHDSRKFESSQSRTVLPLLVHFPLKYLRVVDVPRRVRVLLTKGTRGFLPKEEWKRKNRFVAYGDTSVQTL